MSGSPIRSEKCCPLAWLRIRIRMVILAASRMLRRRETLEVSRLSWREKSFWAEELEVSPRSSACSGSFLTCLRLNERVRGAISGISGRTETGVCERGAGLPLFIFQNKTGETVEQEMVVELVVESKVVHSHPYDPQQIPFFMGRIPTKKEERRYDKLDHVPAIISASL